MKTAQTASVNNAKLKLAAASPPVIVGDIEANADAIIAAVKKANAQEVDYLALPELCLVGATLGSLMRHEVILSAVKRALERICNETKFMTTTFCIGLPYELCGAVRSCAVLISRGRVHSIMPCDCAHIPFGFLPEIDYCGKSKNGMTAMPKVAMRFGNEIFDDEFYTTVLPRFVICMPSSINATVQSVKSIRRKLKESSKRAGVAILYASPNVGESVTNAVFDSYCAIAVDGVIKAEGKPLDDDVFITCEADISSSVPWGYLLEVDKNYEHDFDPGLDVSEEDCIRILDLQALALSRRLEHIGSKGFVIGVSGGLDSTLALLAAVRAADRLGMDRKCVNGISMPGFGTSKHTKNNAQALIEALGAHYREISIEKACIQHFKDIGHSIDDHSVVYENTQARERTQILLDIANKENLLNVGTGDLSESALGWTTFNGDHMSQYGINASIPKTVMRKVVAAAAKLYKEAAEVLESILDTPVSPELLPLDKNGEIAQKTENVLGPYELHDLFLYRFMTYGDTPEQLYKAALSETDFSENEIYRTLGIFLKRFFSQQFKRNCAPECPNIFLSIAPFALTMPSDMNNIAWMREYENIKRS